MINKTKAPDANGGKILNNDNNDKIIVTQTSDSVNQNLDLVTIKWDIEYTDVKFTMINEFGKNKKTSMLMKDFFDKYPDVSERPKIDGIYPKPVKQNVICILKHYNAKVKRNTFTEQIEVYKNGTYSGTLERNEIYFVDKTLIHNLKICQKHLIACIVDIAYDNTYNPIKIYLEHCRKYNANNTGTIKRLCNTLKSKAEYKEQYIKHWLAQMVALAVCNDTDNISAHFMLVLQGAQGSGKTSWFRNLLPEKMQSDYFLEGRKFNADDKDHIMQQASRWLVELGEIGGTFNKSDKDALKNYITAPKDVFRPPYGKETINKKRRVSLCGTVNDIEFLRDQTGSRRFLVLPVDKVDYEHGIDLNALWGEIYDLYLSGYKYWFTPEEVKKITENNAKYTSKTDTISAVEEFFDLFPVAEGELPESDPENPFIKGEWLTAREISDYVNNKVGHNEQIKARVLAYQLAEMNVINKKGHSNRTFYYVEKYKD